MILLEVRTSSGVAGRCDARCYNATHGDCDCVCGGRNHGMGLQRALANTRAGAAEMARRYVTARNLKGAFSLVPDEVKQGELF